MMFLTVLEIVVILLFILGQIGILLSISQSSSTMDGASFFVVLLMIFADVWLGIYYMGKKSEKKEAEQVRHEIDRIKSCEEEISKIQQQFAPQTIGYESDSIERIDVDSALITQNVVRAVDYVRNCNGWDSIGQRINHVVQETQTILSCPGCNTADEKYKYLSHHIMRLEQYRRNYTQILTFRKIDLLNQETDRIELLEKTFGEVEKSKKHKYTEKGNEITKRIPRDLTLLFNYKQTPVSLIIGGFTYCLFSNIILVFDKNGLFSTALDPSAAHIEIQKKESPISVCNDMPDFNNKPVDSDSLCVAIGRPNTTWLYQRPDGGPDRRYSENVPTTNRIDTYEYAEIKISIGTSSLSFSASSQTVAPAFEELAVVYPRRYKTHHTRIPELLMLIKAVSNNDDVNAANNLINRYCNMTKDTNYFCRVTLGGGRF